MTRCVSRTFAFAFLLTAAGVSLPVLAQLPAHIYPSREAWTGASPAELGLDPTRLAEARAYAEGPAASPRLGAGLIVRRGYKVYEWGDTLYRYHVFSVTKGIGALLLGVAADRFDMTLQERARSIYAEFGTNPTTNDPQWLDDVTLEQLATHSAGFEDVISAPRFEYQPGTKWLYTDGGANWLADTLTVRFGEDLREVLTREVLDPLGISRADSGSGDLTWRTVANTNSGPAIGGIVRRDFSAGINLNVDSMARLGLLLERDGAWEGNQILEPAFVQRLRTPAPSIAGLPVIDSNGNPDPDFPNVTAHYGLLWFNNADGAIANVPTDTYWAWGLGDHLIVVIPSLDLVIARTSGEVAQQGASQPRPWARSTPCNAGNWCGRYEVLAPFLTPIVQAVVGQPTVALTSNPSSVAAGGTATLTWSSTNANACTASNGWTGTKPPSGSEVVTVAQTTTYALECSGAGGSVQSSVSISATSNPPPGDSGGGGALQWWLLGALLLSGAAGRRANFSGRRMPAPL